MEVAAFDLLCLPLLALIFWPMSVWWGKCDQDPSILGRSGVFLPAIPGYDMIRPLYPCLE